MMRVSGFTIARQVVDLGYPLQESLRSLLPLVDELIVNVGDVDDGTWEAVQGIGDPRVVAFRSHWDMTRTDGLTLSEETNKALARCTGEWAIYLQSDEVLHEVEIPQVRAALERYRATTVEALSFRYYHFYGSYQEYKDEPLSWYRRATRIVRTGIGMDSVGDACAFMVRDAGALRRPRRRDLPQHIYHYGRARPPADVVRKQRHLERFYEGCAVVSQPEQPEDAEAYVDRRNLRIFTGTHPQVMGPRVSAANWPVPPRPASHWPDWIRRAGVYGGWLIAVGQARVRRGIWARVRRSS